MNDDIQDIDAEIKSALAGVIDEPAEIQQEPEETPESIARSQGWRPKEEFEGDKSKWVPADEFVRRKPLFDKIHEQTRLNKDLQEALKHQAETLKRIEERTRREEQEKYERKLDELQRAKKEAFQSGDEEAFERAEQQIEKVKASQVEESKPQTVPDDRAQVVESWVSKNQWFNTDPALKKYMIAAQNENLAKGMSLEEALRESEREVKAEFAHKFQNPNKEKPSPVIASNPEPKKASIDALPSEFRGVFRTLSRLTGITLDEYIAEQKRAGNLK